MRNPAAGDAAHAPQPDQQPPGPNHLGLQVPYPQNAHSGPTAPVPTQIQLMRIEQRILQDAYTLGLEQQQLATLRMMEAELSRLRAQHVPEHLSQHNHSNSSTPTSQTPLRYSPFMPPSMAPQAFTGAASRAMGSGHPGLPQGMVLPEGWTALPLRRAEGSTNIERSSGAEATPAAGASANSQPAQHDGPASSTGPTDDAGSPLFVPTAPPAQQPPIAQQPSSTVPEPIQTSPPAPEPSVTVPAQTWSLPPTAATPAVAAGPPATPSPAPVAQQRDSDSDTETESSAEEEDDDDEAPRPTPTSKGKARAVEMEEVEDPEA